MKKSPTVFLIAFVLLTGLVLIPFVGVQGQMFRWQNYAGVYETPTPGPGGGALLIDHVNGKPGSFFHVSGFGFNPQVNVSVIANGVDLGNVETNSDGELEFNLNTSSAGNGRYEVVVEQGGDSAATVFFLIPFGDMHPLTGEGSIINLPAGIGETIEYLPIIRRQ